MRRSNSVLVLTGIVCSGMLLHAQQQALTVEMAVAQALSNYSAVRASREDVASAAAAINLARTSYLPRIDGIAQLNNMRLRWTLKPGNDVFVIWNRGWQRLLLSRSDLSLVPDKDVIAVKVRWTFRR
jgi:hypothetical protein